MGPFEVGALQLELPGHFAAFPVGLAAVAHQKFERGLVGQKGIVLAQIAEPQLGWRMTSPLSSSSSPSRIAQQGAFAGAVAADEADFDVVAQGGLGVVEQNLIAVAFVGFRDLKQAGHRE